MAIRHFRGTPCDYNFPVFSKRGANVKFIHRELTGVKLALIGCTSAASSICEATRNNTAVIVGIYLLVHTNSNQFRLQSASTCVWTNASDYEYSKGSQGQVLR